jgi:hypothetical protein
MVVVWEKSLMRNATVCWIAVAVISGLVGYFTVDTSPTTSRISFSGYPKTPADQSLLVDLWNDSLPFIVAREGLALVTEGKREDGSMVRFFCPRKQSEDGFLVLHFPLENQRPLRSVFLNLRLAVFYNFDESAELDIYLKSSATGERFLKFAELGARTEENVIRESFDITEYARGSTQVEVKITARASKLLYNPTPNDPIGYAGAQALRQYPVDKWSARLDLWYDK